MMSKGELGGGAGSGGWKGIALCESMSFQLSGCLKRQCLSIFFGDFLLCFFYGCF